MLLVLDGIRTNEPASASKQSSLWSDFLKNHLPAFLLILFRKKARSAYLLICKRPSDDSLSLPPFCENIIWMNDVAKGTEQWPRPVDETGGSTEVVPRSTDDEAIYCRRQMSGTANERGSRWAGGVRKKHRLWRCFLQWNMPYGVWNIATQYEIASLWNMPSAYEKAYFISYFSTRKNIL